MNMVYIQVDQHTMAISISYRFARIGLLERTCDAHVISVLIQWSDAHPRQSVHCYVNKVRI